MTLNPSRVIAQINAGPCKIVLPRRAGQPRIGPLQYYYPASPTGVMPSSSSSAIASAAGAPGPMALARACLIHGETPLSRRQLLAAERCLMVVPQ
jgi:hypothetical protein